MSSASTAYQQRLLHDAARWALPRLGVYVAGAIAGAVAFAAWATVYTYVWPRTSERQIEYPAPANPGKPALPLAPSPDRTGRSPAIVLQSPQSLLHLTNVEVQTVRDILNPTGAKGDNELYEIGKVPGSILMIPYLPDSVVAKVPKLNGLRYTIDRNGSIILMNPGSYRVIAIIEPSP
jgi:hypothetical protein